MIYNRSGAASPIIKRQFPIGFVRGARTLVSPRIATRRVQRMQRMQCMLVHRSRRIEDTKENQLAGQTVSTAAVCPLAKPGNVFRLGPRIRVRVRPSVCDALATLHERRRTRGWQRCNGDLSVNAADYNPRECLGRQFEIVREIEMVVTTWKTALRVFCVFSRALQWRLWERGYVVIL